MKKLSFIVPVYNVEQYLQKCVDSLLAQDYRDYEIILVDDGSKDSCPSICDEYSQLKIEERKLKIEVIHQKNGGLSAARNAGLKVAQGEYVCFVDSDDYWDENVLGGLMMQVEREQLDVLRFDYQNVRLRNEGLSELGNEREYEVFQPYKNPHLVDQCHEIVCGESYLNMRMCYTCYAVMYIMRREIVPNFSEGLHFEDVDWLPKMMLKAKRVNSTETVVYNYLVRQGSITKTQGDKVKTHRNIEDKIAIMNSYVHLRSLHPDCKWLERMQGMMAADVLTTIACEFYEERREYIRRLKEIQVFPLTIAGQGNTYAKRARIINYLGPHVYCMVMRLKC